MIADVVTIPPKRVRPPKPPPENRTEGFYGPIKLWERVAHAAAQLGRSKSDLVVGILEQWLDAFEKEHQPRKPKKSE